MGQQESEISGLIEMLENLEGKHEQLQETVARPGDELVETHRWNSELGGGAQQLEGENLRLWESSEPLQGKLVRAEGRHQNAVDRLQETIAAGRSKTKDNFQKIQRDVAKLKAAMITTKRVTRKEFVPSKNKQKKFDVPGAIIVHLTRECRENVHDSGVIAMTVAYFEMTKYKNDGDLKQVADLEHYSNYDSDYRRSSDDIPHTPIGVK
jgi:predicted nuclease with TOPRIM domain